LQINRPREAVGTTPLNKKKTPNSEHNEWAHRRSESLHVRSVTGESDADDLMQHRALLF